MNNSSFKHLLNYCLLIVCTSVRSNRNTVVYYDNLEDSEVSSDDKFISARCQSRCLTSLNKQGDGLNMRKNMASESDCQVDTSCASCFVPCSHSAASETNCKDLCIKDSICLESCYFIVNIRRSRSGSCPPQEINSTEMCIRTCSMDSDCKLNSSKCCSNGCGRTCQLAQQMHKVLPEIPEPPMIRDKQRSDLIEVKWKPVQSIGSSPVFYSVEFRPSSKMNNNKMFPWQQIAQTTFTSTVVSQLDPGQWYEFSVVAVNIHGTRGRSSPSKKFYVSPSNRKSKWKNEGPDVHRELSLLATPPPIATVNVGKPFFQNGLLKANVSWTIENVSVPDATVDKVLLYWSPEVCSHDSTNNLPNPVLSAITLDRYFVVYDLKFRCRYLTRVQPISSQGVTGTVSHVTFTTPSCSHVIVVGKVKPFCSIESPSYDEIKNSTLTDTSVSTQAPVTRHDISIVTSFTDVYLFNQELTSAIVNEEAAFSSDSASRPSTFIIVNFSLLCWEVLCTWRIRNNVSYFISQANL